MKSIALIVLAAVIGISIPGQDVQAQDIEHPEMETVLNDNGEQVVVLVGTEQPPDPTRYSVVEEEGAQGPILAVYYIPDGSLVTFFSTTRIKGKAQAPGVSFFPSRKKPEIEKVIGERSFEKEIKHRFVNELFISKEDFLFTEKANYDEIKKMLEKPRN